MNKQLSNDGVQIANEEMEAQPASLATMRMKIKTQLRFCLSPLRMPVGEPHMLVRMQGETLHFYIAGCMQTSLASAEITKGGSSKTGEITGAVAN